MRAIALLALLLGACATDEMDAPSVSFSGERVDVKVYGDGFVQCAAGRVPLEAFVLTMRQRMRALGPGHAAELWVHIDVDRDGGAAARAAVDQLFVELKHMGVKQVAYL
jgi:hypothetical protein